MTTTTFVDEVTVIEASWLNDVNADVYGTRPVATGGTGATTAADARTNLGLGNVDNTSDANKPLSTAQQAALNLKIDNASKDATGGVPGLTLFKLNMRNAANTITSWFTNAATVARTWTLPDKDGTVAMLSDFASPGAIGGTTPAAGTFTTLTVTGNAALGDAEASDTHAIKGATTLLANSASAALKVTQTGAGNAFVVEDSTSPDSTPFVINSGGQTTVGHTSQPFFISGVVPLFGVVGTGNTTSVMSLAAYSADTNPPWFLFGKSRGAIGGQGIVSSGDGLGNIEFTGSDGVINTSAARISASVDGTPGTNDMPGRLVFSTTRDGASSTTEAIRIDSTQSCISNSTGTGTNSYGFRVSSALTGATNNYGFYSTIAAGAGRWNFYAAGTAANYFAGDVQLGKTVTAGGTTGAQTINKTVGTVNFAAAATSLVVTNNLVTTSSIITATVGTNDTTMKSVAVVAAAGSFTLHANAAAAAETRVNFCVFN